MTSLYAEGWRQGSILSAPLPLDAVVLNAVGQPVRTQAQHGRWLVATQDCDLDQTDAEASEPAIELRPVYTEDPPQDWGLRASRLRLTETEYAVARSPRPMVSAAVLTARLAAGDERRDIAPERRRALTKWLGLRYDRPAVPEHLLPLAMKIATEVQRRGNRPTGRRVRDVLMQFDDTSQPLRFSLFAVLEDEADEDDVRVWLAGIAAGVPVELGVADQLEAATAAGISLHLIETSYAADVSRLSWRPNQPEPDGAV